MNLSTDYVILTGSAGDSDNVERTRPENLI